eukprot:TRINITY_DN15389_c0_g1_i3.p1 TRINITY_DN15389_c0_g1~~TRINITY_DN15389_c0_g1_i3.p1  ORF type:complete len:230 (-),score=37.40 TRINITY_DN15389_c0_g1_i3:82-717(-)
MAFPTKEENLATAEKDAEVLLAAARAKNGEYGWTFVKESNGVAISKRALEGKSHSQMRGHIKLPCSADAFMEFIRPTGKRDWDPSFIFGEDVVAYDADHSVIHIAFKAPSSFVTNRDFVIMKGFHTFEGGVRVLSTVSTSHQDVPEKKPYVRGWTWAGFVAFPMSDTECEAVYVLELDPKGWVPGWVSEKVNIDQPSCLGSIKAAIAGKTV